MIATRGKPMKKIWVVLLMACVSLCAKEKNYFSYGDVSAMGAYPMVGVGVRSKNETHCYDLSGHVMPFNRFSPFIFHLKGVYLYYPWKQGVYCGSGLGFLNEPESLKSPSGSLEASIGYQSSSEGTAPLFFEINLIAPFLAPQGTLRAWPGITFGYGF
jgi:hypothetical protein